MKQCNKDCKDCRNLNVRTDSKGYPWAWECMKYELADVLNPSIFKDSKEIIAEVST